MIETINRSGTTVLPSSRTRGRRSPSPTTAFAAERRDRRTRSAEELAS
jgi:hypothetical protein